MAVQLTRAFERIELLIDPAVLVTTVLLLLFWAVMGRWLLSPLRGEGLAGATRVRVWDVLLLCAQCLVATGVILGDRVDGSQKELTERFAVASGVLAVWWGLGIRWLSVRNVDDTLRRTAMLTIGVPVACGWFMALIGPVSPQNLLYGLVFYFSSFLSLSFGLIVGLITVLAMSLLFLGTRWLAGWVVKANGNEMTESKAFRSLAWCLSILGGLCFTVIFAAHLRLSNCECSGSPGVRCEMRKVASAWLYGTGSDEISVWAQMRAQPRKGESAEGTEGPAPTAWGVSFHDVPREQWPLGLAAMATEVAVDREGRLWASIRGYCDVLLTPGPIPPLEAREWRYHFGEGSYVRCLER